MDNYEKAFFQNIEVYLELINNFLSKQYSLEPLGKRIKLVGGFAFKSSLYKEEGVPIIRISNFSNEKIVLDNTKKYTEDPKLEKYQLEEGDIIIAMTGGTIGKLAIVQSGLGKLYLNQRVGKFEIIDKENLIPEYIYWIAKGVQSRINKIGYGGAQPNVSNKQLESLEFAFPPKVTQKKIIEFITDFKNNCISNKEYFNIDVENKIAKIHKQTLKLLSVEDNIEKEEKLLIKLRILIFQDAIQGKLVLQNESNESASGLLEKIKADRKQLIKEKKIKKEKVFSPISDEEKPFELPNGWEWVRFSSIIKSIRYGTSKKCNYNSDDVPVLRIPNISNSTINHEDLKYAKLDDKELKELQLTKDDLLLIRSNGSTSLVGRSAIVKEQEEGFCFAGYLIRVRIFTKYIDPNYINLVLNSNFVRNQIELPIRTTTGVKNINTTEISKLYFPLPPFEEQKHIVEKVNHLMNLCYQLEKNIKQSKQERERLMKAVLEEAFSVGEKVLN
ncbi:restriction endonuclease subunit S [Priestia megaterium]